MAVKNKKDGNKKYIIIIVVLSIFVLALGGFIVYDKVTSDKCTCDEVANNEGNNSLDYWLIK